MRIVHFAAIALLAVSPALAAKPKAKAKAVKTAKTAKKPAKAAEREYPSCLHGKKEWQERGPKILVEKAMHQNAPIEIPDFTAKFGKKNAGAHGSAAPFRGVGGEWVMVQAKDDESSLFLSGVMKCDPEKKEPVLVSLTYVKGDKSGLVKVIEK